MFVGSVETQRMVTKELSDHLLIGNVVFSPGARTKRHTHESDQVIVVTGGRGILATDEEENEVTRWRRGTRPPVGEIHWHGATKDSSFSQISVLHPRREQDTWIKFRKIPFGFSCDTLAREGRRRNMEYQGLNLCCPGLDRVCPLCLLRTPSPQPRPVGEESHHAIQQFPSNVHRLRQVLHRHSSIPTTARLQSSSSPRIPPSPSTTSSSWPKKTSTMASYSIG